MVFVPTQVAHLTKAAYAKVVKQVAITLFMELVVLGQTTGLVLEHLILILVPAAFNSSSQTTAF